MFQAPQPRREVPTVTAESLLAELDNRKLMARRPAPIEDLTKEELTFEVSGDTRREVHQNAVNEARRYYGEQGGLKPETPSYRIEAVRNPRSVGSRYMATVTATIKAD